MLLMWNVSACLCIKEEWSVQKLSLNSLQRVQDNGAVNRNEMISLCLSTIWNETLARMQKNGKRRWIPGCPAKMWQILSNQWTRCHKTSGDESNVICFNKLHDSNIACSNKPNSKLHRCCFAQRLPNCSAAGESCFYRNIGNKTIL